MLSVRLDDAEAAALKALCERSGLTQSELNKRSIAALARGQLGAKPPAALARELGLIGSFDGPRDLATRSRRYLRRALREKTAR
ncbi:MAG: ribbon-helix-helix protein, CopG family [Dehalococcoidia bacterium]|nr:ribbon-helix-helix protein, CopG family [Dehalococcoidia bacterium]